MTPASSAVTPGRNLVVLMAVGFLALLLVAVMTIWLVNRNVAYSEATAHTLEYKAEILRVLLLAQDAETGQRGYLLTRDEKYLDRYNVALSERDDRFRRLEEESDGSVAQRDAVAGLRAALQIKLDELAETIALGRAGRIAEALAIVETDRGREAMRAVRRSVTDMVAHEDQVAAERAADSIAAGWLLLVVSTLSLILVAAMAAVAALLVRRSTRALTRAADQLREANAGLEAAVAERTSELVDANEEIQRFAYIVSHDLRAPLVNVMGFTSELDAARRVLKEQIDGLDEEGARKVKPEARLAIEEDLPEAIGFIRTSTQKMDRLINAILKLSREGRRVVTPETIAIDALVSGISTTMHSQTTAVGAEIVVEPGVPRLVSDRMTVEQIFQNLIENAVKYLDASRRGRIVVRGKARPGFVEYTVEDNGRGIDAKDHERVFELFRRAGAQDQPGDGLGLAFVRASVRRLGGSIRLTSEPGRGSTFHLTFPSVYKPASESLAA